MEIARKVPFNIAFILDSEGIFVDASIDFCALCGFETSELLGRSVIDFLDDSGRILFREFIKDVNPPKEKRFITGHRKKEGGLVEIDVVLTSFKINEDIYFAAVAHSCQEAMQVHNEWTFSEFLQLYTKSSTLSEYLNSLTEQLHEWSGCQNIGIRILDVQGYIPFESSKGFCSGFMKSENWLSVQHDSCFCIRAFTDGFDKIDKKALTSGGSLFLRNVAEFIGQLSEEEKKNYRGVCALFGYATLLIVPVRNNGTVICTIQISDERPDNIPEQFVEFLEHIAPFLGESVHRFQLETVLQRNLDTQKFLNTFLSLQTQNIPLEELFDRVLEDIVKIPWLSLESKGSISLVESEPEMLVLKANKGLPEANRKLCEKVPFGTCLCGRAARTGNVVFADHIDERHDIYPEDCIDHGHYCVPIRSEDTTLGVISFYLEAGHHRSSFEEDFLFAVANTLSIIIRHYRTEQALHEREKSLAHAQRIARIGNWDWVIDTGVLTWSDEVFRIFGLEKNKIKVGFDAFMEQVHPDDRKRVRTAIEKAINEKKSYEIEHRVLLPSGYVRIVCERGDVIYDEKGHAVRMIGTVQDISEQKRTIKEHNRLASFPELDPNPIIETDLKGEITYINRSASNKFPEIIIDGINHPILKVLTGTFPTFSLTPESYLVREVGLKDNIYELHISLIEENKRYRCYITDITERKTAEKLRDNMMRLKGNLMSAIAIISGELDLEGTFRETVSAVTRLLNPQIVGLAEVDLEGNILYVNHVMDGNSKSLPANHPIQILIKFLVREPSTILIPDIKEYPSTKEFADSDPHLKSFLGTSLIYKNQLLGVLYIASRANGITFGDQDREILENLAIHTSVAINNARLYEQIKDLNEDLEGKIAQRTEDLQEALSMAETANKAKSTFLANMSHELRTPLNAIIGFSQILKEAYYGNINEMQKEFVEDILVSAQHLLNLINDILDLSKIEAGKIEISLSKVNLLALVNNSIVMIKEKALRHGIAIKLELPASHEDFEIDLDEIKMKQVLFNLLSNAAKFTPDGGTIIVGLKKDHDGAIILYVSDTGIGVEPEFHEKIFEEFFQARGGLNRENKGTGLGLSIARRFIEMHGGTLDVMSEGLNKGSTFTIRLPAAVLLGKPAVNYVSEMKYDGIE